MITPTFETNKLFFPLPYIYKVVTTTGIHSFYTNNSKINDPGIHITDYLVNTKFDEFLHLTAIPESPDT